jgi:hypothetical protein
VKLLELFGSPALTDLDIESMEQLPQAVREAAIEAKQEIQKKRLLVGVYVISRGQVVAIPSLQYDALNNVVVADVRGFVFFGRDNRAGRVA